MAAVAKQVLILLVTALKWQVSSEVQCRLQDQRSHPVQHSLHEKLSRISLITCCDSTRLYISWIQTYIYSFNAHMLYLLYRCLKIFGVGMAHSEYLIVCGLQNRGFLGRFEEILRIFSPKYPDRLWAHPISLKWVTITASPQAKRSELEANHSRPSST